MASSCSQSDCLPAEPVPRRVKELYIRLTVKNSEKSQMLIKVKSRENYCTDTTTVRLEARG